MAKTTTIGDENAVPSYVPAAFRTLVRWAAGVIGIPASVVAAQWRVESDFSDTALSDTGAEGLTQIEPGTWQSASCTGNPDNANDSARCYAKIMYSLVKQYKGNVRDALAAYNAGSADLSAGYGYADEILSAAGEAGVLAGAGTGVPADQATTQSSCQVEDCAFGCVPNVSIAGVTVWQGECLVTYRQAREAIGAAALVGGMLLSGVGVNLLIRFAAAAAVAQVVSPVMKGLGINQATAKAKQAVPEESYQGAHARSRATERAATENRRARSGRQPSYSGRHRAAEA